MGVFLCVFHPPSLGLMVSSSEVWHGSFYESCVGYCFPSSLVSVWRIVGALQFEFDLLLNASRSPRHVCTFVHYQTNCQPDLFLALLMKQDQLQGMGGYRLARAVLLTKYQTTDWTHTQHRGSSPHVLLLLGLVAEDYCSAPTTRYPH